MVSSLQRSAHGDLEGPVFAWKPPEPLPAWPQPATTDAGGRFTLRGLGRDLRVALAIDDPRFAFKITMLETGGTVDGGLPGNPPSLIKLDTKSGANRLTLALEPAQIITGRVTDADSGKPVPHAALSVRSRSNRVVRVTHFETDHEGRFRANPTAGEQFFVNAEPPHGQPYLGVTKVIDWPKGAVEQSVDLALTRGVAIRGTVTEKVSGKPVVGAVVTFTPYTLPRTERSFQRGGSSLTSSDGSFRIAAAPEQGYLVVQGPRDDYVLREMGAEGAVFYARPGNRRFYAHGYTFLDLKAAKAEQAANLTVERGLTVRGRVVGPDDRPVEDALIISRLILKSTPAGGWKLRSLRPARGHVREGRFELHGLAPDSEVPVYFLDSQHQLGATIRLSGKLAKDGPLTVRLARCGAVQARLVSSAGKPLSGLWLRAGMIVTSGTTRQRLQQQPGQLLRDAASVENIDPANYAKRLVSDAQGRIVFPALIPGATYLFEVPISALDPGGSKSQEITAKPGETLDLGDIQIREAGAPELSAECESTTQWASRRQAPKKWTLTDRNLG